MTFPSLSATGRVSGGGGGRVLEEQVKASERPGGCGTGESLGTDLGEYKAETRRGRTFTRLIAEGSLSHGVHVRALPREGKASLGNQPCSREKVHP